MTFIARGAVVLALAACGGSDDKILLTYGLPWDGLVTLRIGKLQPNHEHGWFVFHDEVPAEGTPIEVVFPTPCGDKIISVPFPSHDGFNELGRMESPDLRKAEWPKRTNVFLDPKLTSKIVLGQLTVAPKGLTTFDIGCAKSIRIDGQEHPLPAFEEPSNSRQSDIENHGAASYGLFIGRPGGCYLDEEIAYGRGESRSRRLEGVGPHALANTTYEVFFEPVPETMYVRGGIGGLRALRDCE